MYLRGHISDSFLLTSHNAKPCKLHLGTSGESLSFKLLTCSLIKKFTLIYWLFKKSVLLLKARSLIMDFGIVMTQGSNYMTNSMTTG